MTELSTPADATELAATVASAFASETPIYPVGGGTSLDFGLPIVRPGLNVALTGLNRICDYPARDMTITVEAGVTMSALAETLAAQRQRLPLDVPEGARATLGGVIATNFSGPLRFAHGTARDYVIGVAAIDGRGTLFHGGGRVVKNVAGYDFCKLLTGSLGTLGIITQLTLKVKPIPERSALVGCRLKNLEQAESLLAALVDSRTTPCAVELVAGPQWHDNPALETMSSGDWGWLIVGLEGTAAEVDWMRITLLDEWRALGAAGQAVVEDQTEGLWKRLREFPAGETPVAAMALKIGVPAGRTVELIRELQAVDPECSILSHAGNGIIFVRYPTLPAGSVSRIVVGRLQPVAQRAGGHAVLLSTTLAGEITRQAAWGGAADAAMVMEAVKRQFDPKNILNPGRFVYSNL